MWLACFIPQPQHQPSNQTFLDLCFHFSSEVFIQGHSIFIKLSPTTSKYWRLNELLSQPANNKHPILQHLHLLNSFVTSSKTSFVMAASPSHAAMALKQNNQNESSLLNVYSPIEIQKLFLSLNPKSLETLLEDQFIKKPSLMKSWRLFLEDLSYLGIRNILEVKTLFQEAGLRLQFVRRFPNIVPILIRRLILLSQDYSLTLLTPSSYLFENIPLESNRHTCPSENELLKQIENILWSWQLRLESRNSIVKDLELKLSFSECDYTFEFKFPEGLRRMADILPLIQEKLQNLSTAELRLFSLPLLNAELSSGILENPYKNQLHLFDQKAEVHSSHMRLLNQSPSRQMINNSINSSTESMPLMAS